MCSIALTKTQIKVINDLTMYDTDVLYWVWLIPENDQNMSNKTAKINSNILWLKSPYMLTSKIVKVPQICKLVSF